MFVILVTQQRAYPTIDNDERFCSKVGKTMDHETLGSSCLNPSSSPSAPENNETTFALGWMASKQRFMFFYFLKCATPSTPSKDTRGSSDLSPLQHQDMSNLAGVLQQIEKVELVRWRRRRNS